MWVPVVGSWRLNERHYGSLQGLNKAETAKEYGEEQVNLWRRSFDVRPPRLPKMTCGIPNDPKYARLHQWICLRRSVLKTPLIDSFLCQENIARMLAGRRVLIVAHGNTLRALVKYADRISDDYIANVNIPTGIPLVYELEDDLKPIRSYYLGDQESARRLWKLCKSVKDNMRGKEREIKDLLELMTKTKKEMPS